MDIIKPLVELYKKAATDLPKDVEASLKNHIESESNDNAKEVLRSILKNIGLAREEQKPICQDTGTPIFYVCYNTQKQSDIRKQIIEATRTATKDIPLRPNAIDPITGKNSGDNTGINFPVIHFHESESDELKIDLILKGGGSENISESYKLPDSRLDAARDINGIKKCIIDAMVKAQGKGCSPNIVGVGIGGTMDECMATAKKQLLRNLDDINPDPTLKDIEEDCLKKINSLGIGPLGLAGDTTALAVKIGKISRHPASFYVCVCFMCWACRRKTLIFDGEKYRIE